MQIKTEAKIGIIVAATILLVFWGINYLKGRNILKRTDVYHAVFQDVQGLDVSSPVNFRGYKIGMVTDIDFPRKEMDKVIVSFTVDHSVDVPNGSIVELYSADLLGTKALRIFPASGSDQHQYGDTLISKHSTDLISSLGNEILPLTGKLDSAVSNLNTLLGNVNNNLDQETMDHFKKTMENLEISSEMIRNQLKTGELKKSLSALEEFMQTLDDNRSKLDNIFSNLEAITDSVAKANISEMIKAVNMTFSETGTLIESINQGEGSIGQLAVNDSLYMNLNLAVESLNRLLTDLNENPHRYVRFSVFGGKNKKE